MVKPEINSNIAQFKCFMLIKISLVILFYVITNNSNITIPIPVNSNFTHEKLGGLSKNGFPQLEDKKKV